MSPGRQPSPSPPTRSTRVPRVEVPGGTYFVTFRLTRRTRCNLTRPAIGSIIIEALRHFHGIRYRLYDYTVMPDHVHLILQPLITDGTTYSLQRILGSIKGWTAYTINRKLRRRGPVWQAGCYDHIIRNEADYREKARYIWENPLRRGLVRDPAHWQWWSRGVEGCSLSEAMS